MPVLKTEEIADKPTWESFLKTREEANFLQSWNWSVFHTNLGKKVFRFGLFENKRLAGAALAVKETAKRGTYLTIAGGPLLDWPREDYFAELVSQIRSTAGKEGCSFIRVRPQELASPELAKRFSDLGFRKAPMHLTADLTIQLDLTKSEPELLAEMRKTTRYEIKRAEKLGIKVESSTDPAEIRAFYGHQISLAKKHKFVPFAYDFLHEQFKAFAADGEVLLLNAYLDKQLLASAFVIYYGVEAVYHYGISTEKNAKLPGAYACQWEAIKEAKRRGMKRYNLWGVAPKEETGHRFYGVSIFKRGFGGEEIQYLPTQDLPLSPKYYLTYALELGRKKIRKL